MSTQSEMIRRDKASAKLAAAKKRERKEPITGICPADAIAEIYGANYILCARFILFPIEESFFKISSDITGGNYCYVHV